MSILSTWKAWNLQMAVFAGSGTALVTLLQHAPARVACMRGAMAWFAVLLLGKGTAWVLERVEILSAEAAKELARANAAEEEASEV
ncbi:MAG: hypothetical protein P1V35_14700 [Planctomycetota bacterium]|nr:hypothetical protein [Planctomycetota bacterium]